MKESTRGRETFHEEKYSYCKYTGEAFVPATMHLIFARAYGWVISLELAVMS